ncbi:MAG TPA: phage holin family protein [Flavobacterium sp.]|nr:phage holin family protein [Flavobacterium sp.]HWS60092.1 phage holin family protein [Flavobacterium sp.]
MKLLIRIIITSVLVLLISHFMTGVHVTGFVTALLVAVVLGLLNIFIKPIFVLLTLPFTIVTLGLFLLVINAIIILLCTNIVGGFSVDTFWTALLFSVVLSLSQSILFAIVGKD